MHLQTLFLPTINPPRSDPAECPRLAPLRARHGEVALAWYNETHIGAGATCRRLARDLHKFVIGPMLKEGWRGTIGMIRWSELRKRLLEHPQAPDPKSPRKVIQRWLNRAIRAFKAAPFTTAWPRYLTFHTLIEDHGGLEFILDHQQKAHLSLQKKGGSRIKRYRERNRRPYSEPIGLPVTLQPQTLLPENAVPQYNAFRPPPPQRANPTPRLKGFAAARPKPPASAHRGRTKAVTVEATPKRLIAPLLAERPPQGGKPNGKVSKRSTEPVIRLKGVDWLYGFNPYHYANPAFDPRTNCMAKRLFGTSAVRGDTVQMLRRVYPELGGLNAARLARMGAKDDTLQAAVHLYTRKPEQWVKSPVGYVMSLERRLRAGDLRYAGT